MKAFEIYKRSSLKRTIGYEKKSILLPLEWSLAVMAAICTESFSFFQFFENILPTLLFKNHPFPDSENHKTDISGEKLMQGFPRIN